MKNYKIYQLILILVPFVFSFALGLDIYIPIVPQMTEIFQTSPAMIQLTLSLFLFTTGAGQLFIGPLADQYGRKPVFFFSSFLFIIGGIGCAFSNDILELIGSRIISSLGACGMLVTSFALIRDLFENEESAKMFSFLNGAIGISPTFAPIVGGYLSLYFGWHSVFIFLALIGILALIVTKQFIQETLPPAKRVKISKDIFKRYKEVFSNRQFLIFTSITGFAEAIFFCFFSISPFIIIGLLEIPTHEFGYYFAVFGAVIGLGGFASGKIVEKQGIDKTISLGIALMFFGGFTMLIWYHLFALSLLGFLIPMVLACTGAIFLVGAGAAAALEPFGSIAGTAAAGFGALQFTISSAIGALLMLFPVNSTLPYGIAILLMALFSLICLRLDKNSKKIIEKASF